VINHDDLVREEFARQADTFSASSAITDLGLTQHFVTSMGDQVFSPLEFDRGAET
jgi:hypothetical protein